MEGLQTLLRSSDHVVKRVDMVALVLHLVAYYVSLAIVLGRIS